MQQATIEAASASADILGTVQRLEKVTSAIAVAVEQQGAATREIAGSAARVSETIAAVVTHIAEIGRMAQYTGTPPVS